MTLAGTCLFLVAARKAVLAGGSASPLAPATLAPVVPQRWPLPLQAAVGMLLLSLEGPLLQHRALCLSPLASLCGVRVATFVWLLARAWGLAGVTSL